MFQKVYSYLTDFLKISKSIRICNDTLSWVKNNPQYARVTQHISESFTPIYGDFNEISGKKVVLAKDQFIRPTYNRFLAVINNAKIHTTSGYIQLPSGEILLETAWVEENIMGNKRYYNQSGGNQIVKNGQWFSIILYWSENYYHWFCDVLPRLHKVVNRLPSEVNFIVPANMEAWKTESLEAIGINLNKCVAFDGNIPWELEEMYYAPPVTMTGDIEKESIQWVRSKLTTLSSNIHPWDLLFISLKIIHWKNRSAHSLKPPWLLRHTGPALPTCCIVRLGPKFWKFLILPV